MRFLNIFRQFWYFYIKITFLIFLELKLSTLSNSFEQCICVWQLDYLEILLFTFQILFQLNIFWLFSWTYTEITHLLQQFNMKFVVFLCGGIRIKWYKRFLLLILFIGAMTTRSYIQHLASFILHILLNQESNLILQLFNLLPLVC